MASELVWIFSEAGVKKELDLQEISWENIPVKNKGEGRGGGRGSF